MALYTVLGGHGFVGRALVARLAAGGYDCQVVGRGDAVPARLGHAIYCVGTEGAGREINMVEAHVSLAADILKNRQFESFTYLSSTRVYLGLPPDAPAHEDATLLCRPQEDRQIFNLSKLAGEALCLALDNPAVRVARLSNVYGAGDRGGNFLTFIVRQILSQGSATFFNTMQSAKDYVDVADVAEALELLPQRATSRVFNIGGGRNVTNREIADILAAQTGVTVALKQDAADYTFPPLSIDRLQTEIGVRPRDFSERFPLMIQAFRQQAHVQH